MRKCLWILGSLIIMLLFIQVNVFAQDEAVVAKIGERKITMSDFKRVVDYLDAERQKMLETNPQLKETVLRQFIQSMVISDLAKQKGFDRIPEIKNQLQFFSDNFLANEYLKREVAQKVTVSDDEVKTYYDSHKDEFKTQEMVKARHILVRVENAASEDEKKKAKDKAEMYLKKIKDGEDFAKMAAEVSDDPGSKAKGGDLGFFPKGRMVKSFEDAAFALKPGETSGIVETQFGFHIIKVEDKKEPTIESFDAVKERIKQKLAQDRTRKELTDFIDKAMKDSKTEIYPDVLTGEKK
ncbi:MAG: PpiC-type peptidyl-prolyl cis-trans isomerase [Nitrospirae bacterium]|nr:PpiC-type peptidyl-prolyl cis-trans isomerase [Nitrospirota bacterium]